jgi:sec-independent protein translocase protein TatC
MTSKPSQAQMTFFGHIDVLRRMFFRVALICIVIAIGFFVAMPYLFDGVILGPCRHDFAFYQLLHSVGDALGLTSEFFTRSNDVHLMNITLTSPFFIHLSTAFWLSVVVGVPYILYEIWRFIAPALYKKEKKPVRMALFVGTLMFYLGVTVAYFMVFPLTLRFLANYELSSLVPNQLTLDTYIDNFMMMHLMMGLVFELPMVTWLLSLLGIVDRSMLRKYRRHATVLIFILAAIITPTGDPFTLTIVALPLCLLYELSIWMIKKPTPEIQEV